MLDSKTPVIENHTMNNILFISAWGFWTDTYFYLLVS